MEAIGSGVKASCYDDYLLDALSNGLPDTFVKPGCPGILCVDSDARQYMVMHMRMQRHKRQALALQVDVLCACLSHDCSFVQTELIQNRIRHQHMHNAMLLPPVSYVLERHVHTQPV